MAAKITNKLIQLPPEVSIDRVIDHPHSIELFLSYPEQHRLCPFCGSSDCVIRDSGRSLTVRHPAVAGRGSFLSFHVPRLRCKRCGASFSTRPYFVHPTLKLSVSAWLSVSAALMTTRSLRDIAVDNCLTESQVLSVLYAVTFPRPDLPPQTLRIDEFKGSSGVYDKDSGHWNVSRFHCNISDGSIGCVVGVLPRTDLENTCSPASGTTPRSSAAASSSAATALRLSGKLAQTLWSWPAGKGGTTNETFFCP